MREVDSKRKGDKMREREKERGERDGLQERGDRGGREEEVERE